MNFTRHYSWLFAAAALSVAGCTGKGSQADVPKDTAHAPATLSGDLSIYNLTSAWTNQDGKAVALKDLSGRPQVLAIIFTRCPSACPRLLVSMKDIEAATNKNGPGRIGFVLVSMDPDYDTPQVLHQFAADRGLDLKNWTLLRGKESDVTELANVLNVRIRKLPDGVFDHSNIIHVLDANGVLVYQQTGLNADTAPTLKVLEDLAPGKSPGG